MHPLSGIDIHHLVNELKEWEGAKIENIWGSVNGLSIELYHKTAGKQFLNIILPHFVYISAERFHNDTTPLSTYLRNHVRGKKLNTIQQEALERIITVRMAKESFSLILELFGNGNIIILDGTGIIRYAHEYANYKDRSIQSRHTYQPPPTNRKAFDKDFEIDKKNLGTTLASSYGFGGYYADILLGIVKIDKETTHVGPSERLRIFEAFQQILHMKPTPTLLLLHTEPNDWTIFQSEESGEEKKSDEETQAMPTISACIATFVKTPQKKDTKKDKIKNIIEKQHLQQTAFEDEIRENSRLGEIIYERYQELTGIIKAITEARKTKNLQTIAKSITNKNISLDPATGKLTITIEE